MIVCGARALTHAAHKGAVCFVGRGLAAHAGRAQGGGRWGGLSLLAWGMGCTHTLLLIWAAPGSLGDEGAGVLWDEKHRVKAKQGFMCVRCASTNICMHSWLGRAPPMRAAAWDLARPAAAGGARKTDDV